jgi:hypothetical protein
VLSAELVSGEYIVRSKQFTDDYRLALAVHCGDRAVTFYQGITPTMVRGAEMGGSAA